MRSVSFTFFRASFHFVPFPGGERNRQSLVLIQEDKFINCREIYKILTPESVISLCFKVVERFPKNSGNWSGYRPDSPLSKMAWKRLWVFLTETWSKSFLRSSIRANFRMTLKNGFGKCSLFFFYQQMDEKIKTWPARFPAKENPNLEKALFDWPIVLQYDIKVKYPLISRDFRA